VQGRQDAADKRQLQPGAAPQPIRPAWAHRVAVAAEKDPDAVVAVARYCADSATIRASTGTSRAAFVDR
jgi:hypothetical protein